MEASASHVDPQVTIMGSLYVTLSLRRAREPRARSRSFWYDNGLRPPMPLGIDPDDPRQRLGEGDNGLMIVGEKGEPHLRRVVRHAAPACRWNCTARTSVRRRRSRAWRATTPTGCRPARAARRACSNFEYGARLTEFMLLGNLALRTGKVVKWDAEGMKATNAPEAQPLIEGTYRKGWELPV